MVAKKISRSRSNGGSPQPLLLHSIPATSPVGGPDDLCIIGAIEKRRDGGTRYWCSVHKGDATAKGGVAATKCCLADRIPLRIDEIEDLDIDRYKGGVALWGAVPAIYDTTRQPLEIGIHIHARPRKDSKKEIDFTYKAVRILGKKLPRDGIIVYQEDAIYFMISSIFGFKVSYVPCKYCNWPHLDKDFFSVQPHRRHLCFNCGKHFLDWTRGIGNPIVGVRQLINAPEHGVRPAAKKIKLKQRDFPGGIQIWGSNPAFLWTQPKDEEAGIHVHAFKNEYQPDPDLDDTYSEVLIDGVKLDSEMVRFLMVQNVLPSLKGRVMSMACPSCGHGKFDTGEFAFRPSSVHTCDKCGEQFATPGRKRNMVANPLPKILEGLGVDAPRTPRNYCMNLMPDIL